MTTLLAGAPKWRFLLCCTSWFDRLTIIIEYDNWSYLYVWVWIVLFLFIGANEILLMTRLSTDMCCVLLNKCRMTKFILFKNPHTHKKREKIHILIGQHHSHFLQVCCYFLIVTFRWMLYVIFWIISTSDTTLPVRILPGTAHHSGALPSPVLLFAFCIYSSLQRVNCVHIQEGSCSFYRLYG